MYEYVAKEKEKRMTNLKEKKGGSYFCSLRRKHVFNGPKIESSGIPVTISIARVKEEELLTCTRVVLLYCI